MTKQFISTVTTGVCALAVSAGVLLAETEAERKAVTEEWDRQNLRKSTGVVTDTSKEFLRVGDAYDGIDNFVVAKEAPTVDFAPIRGFYPEFFPEDNNGLWSQWGEVTKGPNGCYYMSIGDHRSLGSKVYIIEYDPVKKDQKIAVDVGRLCGWEPWQHTDGKIHGRMDVMPDGTLVAATWLGRNVSQKDIDRGWKGGYFMTYNVFTGKAEYLGVPVRNHSWHYHVTDTRTGVFMGVGDGFSKGTTFVAYDVAKRQVLYAGVPTDNIKWNLRATLLDPRTGILYSSNEGPEKRFIYYDQSTNRFGFLDCTVPKNPVTGEQSNLRAYTEGPAKDGLIYCMSWNGAFFTFSPEEQTTEVFDVNWGDKGVYTTSTAVSPGGRYIYYIPGSHGEAWKWDAPVVQFDVETRTKKVIAFLGPYCHEKYGYVIGGTYGIELSEDGSLLVANMNGIFGPQPKGGAFGYPSIMAVHIPASERVE